MRMITVLAVAAMAVSCGQKDKVAEGGALADASADAAAVADDAKSEARDMPAGFPKMSANYRATYDIRAQDAEPMQMTLEVEGAKKMRFEMPHFQEERAAAGDKIVGVFDEATNRYLMFSSGADAPEVAVVMPFENNVFDLFHSWQNESGEKPRKAGSEKVAGLRCDVWEVPADVEGSPASQACITRDGIILRAGDAGAEPEMLASSVDKGRVAAARFAVPEGFEIIDMTPCQAVMEQAMAAAQSGEQPDMAKMMECQELSMRAGAVFGQ